MVPYSFYTDEFRGVMIAPEEWPGLEARAQAQLERWKQSIRVEGTQRDVQMAVCAMAEALGQIDSANTLCKASIGSVSVEYRVRGRERWLLDRAASYLDVYRGVS